LFLLRVLHYADHTQLSIHVKLLPCRIVGYSFRMLGRRHSAYESTLNSSFVSYRIEVIVSLFTVLISSN